MGKHQPALLGGLFIGVLSSLPYVQMCCCLWIICGGVLVVYLQQERTPMPVQTGDAVLGGLLAGVIGAVIASLAFMALAELTGDSLQQTVHEALQGNNDMPPQMREMIERFMKPGTLGLMSLLFNIPVYAVFGMLGSLLGLAFFRKKTPPQAPPPTMG